MNSKKTKKIKRVLCISQRYHPAKGGAELFARILSEYLANNKGYFVDHWTTNALSAEYLWDLKGDTIDTKEEIIEGVNVKRFAIGNGILKNWLINKIYRTLFGNLPFFAISNLASCPTTFEMLDEINNIEQYDAVVVSTTPYYFLFYVGYKISKKLGIPLIIAPALHTGVEKDDTLRKKYLKKTVIPFFEHSSKIILNTKSEGDAIFGYCKKNGVEIDKKKFVVVGQGVFLNQISQGNGERFRNKYKIQNDIVFQVGSKSFEKGSISLINAMIKCWDKDLDVTLVFGGGYNEEFSKYIENLKEEYKSKILNIDNISDEEKWDLFDAGHIFSMVSKTDSFGIVYLEAWTYSKPVFACENKVMREVISNNEDGYLIPFDDTDKMANKIEYLLNNPSERKKMGENGKKKVKEKYDWEKNLNKIGEIFDNL